MKTKKMSCSHALIKYLTVQKIMINGKKEPLFPGAFGIYGHGNVAVSYTHLTLPTIYSV